MDLIFSDIHADIEALETIMDLVNSEDFIEKFGNYSRIINLGDILERGTHPKQVLTKLKQLSKNYPIISVMGNHDEAFLYGKQVSGSSLESIDAHSKLAYDDLTFFRRNDDGTFGKQQYLDKKNKLICVHGGPLDPVKITPKNAGAESWLYQKSWQRLSEEDFEFFSYSGYHYKASSAFAEGKKTFENFVILCGHQHIETVIKQDPQTIKEILSSANSETEKISNFILQKREIIIEKNNNYLIRLGLGGPEGYYGLGNANPQFGIIQYNPTKVILFNINSKL